MSKDKSHRDKPIQFFTMAEVAERLDVSARTVRRWIESGDVVAHPVWRCRADRWGRFAGLSVGATIIALRIRGLVVPSIMKLGK